jgi:hypothetical protein
VLQRLKPKHVKDWHDTLLKSGGKDGNPLSARTVGHAHRVLHRALQIAVEDEVLSRNVAGVKRPPRVEEEEIEILTTEQIDLVLNKLEGHPLYAIRPSLKDAFQTVREAAFQRTRKVAFRS